MLSFEQMNIYDVLVPSGAGENRIIRLPSVRKVGATHASAAAVPAGRSGPPAPGSGAPERVKVWPALG